MAINKAIKISNWAMFTLTRKSQQHFFEAVKKRSQSKSSTRLESFPGTIKLLRFMSIQFTLFTVYRKESMRCKQNQKLIDLLSGGSQDRLAKFISLFTIASLTKRILTSLERSEILRVIIHSVKNLKYIMITCTTRRQLTQRQSRAMGFEIHQNKKRVKNNSN